MKNSSAESLIKRIKNGVKISESSDPKGPNLRLLDISEELGRNRCHMYASIRYSLLKEMHLKNTIKKRKCLDGCHSHKLNHCFFLRTTLSTGAKTMS